MTVQTNIEQFNAALRQWATRQGLTLSQALAHKTADVAYFVSRELQQSTPGKGLIRAEALSRLKAGGGITVRPSVRRSMEARYHAATRLTDKRLVIGRGKTKAGSVISKKKRLNLQALAVRAEIALRERGRGFRAYAAKIPLRAWKAGATRARDRLTQHPGRYHQILAEAGLQTVQHGAQSYLVWGRDKRSEIGDAMNQPAGRAAIARGIAAATADINIYLERKLAEDLAAAMR